MLKDIIRAALDRLDRLLVPIAASNSWLASFYYLACSRQFRREHRAVLAGRLAYARSLRRDAPPRSSPLLRRNVHRLEKGLVMQPRLPVFAEDYIGETVAEYRRCVAGGRLEDAEACWAREVLEQYFRVVRDTPPIKEARALFAESSASEAGEGDVASSVPRARANCASSDVSYQQFLDLCRQRRSVRWFEPRAVPREAVERAVSAAAQAPSACNRQPFLFRYFDRPEDARRIARFAIGTGGYADNIPALLLVLGDLSAYPAERDRHLVYIDAALASMQLMLALETLGLASCPINWPDIEKLERRMDAELGLPRHLRPVMLIALGYPQPGGGVPFSAKKPTQALLRTSNDFDA